MSSKTIKCTRCGRETGETEKQINSAPKPCPYCGSIEKTVKICVHEKVTLNLKKRIRGKVKNDSYRSKDKLRREFIRGDELHKKSGKWNKKVREIDKDNDLYKEVIVDPETGEIIHECEEPLSEHINHGSAKNKNDKKA